MKLTRWVNGIVTVTFLILSGIASAEGVKETIAIFQQAGQSGDFFKKSYAYAVFPSVGAGGIGIGGAYGKGQVYVHGKFVGLATLRQVSLGFQLGGKTYSQIIFFEDEHAFEDFKSGKLEFGANASVAAITTGADAGVATNGVHSGASEGQHDATTVGEYQNGTATFIVAKGGLMASASLAGEKFTFEPRTSEPAPE
jgi:lipid-binding SYLF domain-containing protein